MGIRIEAEQRVLQNFDSSRIQILDLRDKKIVDINKAIFLGIENPEQIKNSLEIQKNIRSITSAVYNEMYSRIFPRENKETISPDKVVFVTNTLYKDWYLGNPGSEGDVAKVRGDITLKTIKTATEKGHPIVIADGGSSPEFINEAKKLGATVVDSSSTPGRAPQRRVAFEKGANLDQADVFFYIQAEKVGIIKDSFALALPILRGEADIVVPAREPNLFRESYPDYMYRSEVKVNRTYNYVLRKVGWLPDGVNLDWFFGSVVFHKKLLPLFMEKYSFDISGRTGGETGAGARPKVNPEMHSDGHYFPIIKALSQGLRVASIDVSFVYPKEQKNNETSIDAREQFMKRRKQDAFTYRDEMIHFVRYLLDSKDPKTKIRELK